MNSSSDIRTAVRDKYGSIASTPGTGCCGGGDSRAALDALGYTKEQKAQIPDGADLGLGCGNPLEYATVKPGETILDLGSGAGIDVFLAARETGPTGRAIGVDMTPAMLEKARANAAKTGLTNVEFRLGEIENLPVADASVDVIISNCVVNLSPDKARVFAEALRVLKPGGRLLISDLVLNRDLPPEIRDSVAAYVGCVAGAVGRDEYLELIRGAGFESVDVVAENRYESYPEGAAPKADSGSGCCGSPGSAGDYVTSIKVRGVKKAR